VIVDPSLEPEELELEDLEPEEEVRVEAPPDVSAPDARSDERDSMSSTFTRTVVIRPAKRGWGLRVCLLAVLVVGEISFHYRDVLHRDAVGAMAMLRAVADGLASGPATSPPAAASSSAVSMAPASAPSAALPPPPAAVPDPAVTPTIASVSPQPGVVDPPLAPAPMRVRAPEPPAPSTPSTTPIPPDMGLLETSEAQPGHRIFVNEHIVGQTPQSVLVKCGNTTVKIGSAGEPRVVDIPCGRKVSVGQP
jgi:hypothetical protein